MRKLRQDEIELIEKFRKRNPPFDSIPEEIPGLLEINDHPIFHMEEDLPTIDEFFGPGDPVYHIKWNKRRKT